MVRHQGHHFEATTANDHATVYLCDQSHHHEDPQYNTGSTHYGYQYHSGPSLHFHEVDAMMGDTTTARVVQ